MNSQVEILRFGSKKYFFAICLTSVAVLAFMLWAATQHDFVPSQPERVVNVAQVVPKPRAEIPLSHARLEHAKGLLHPKPGDSLTSILHSLRWLKPFEIASNESLPSRQALIGVLTDYGSFQEWFPGKQCYVKSPFGLQAIVSQVDPACQAHNDQILAAFAELGISVDRSLETSGGIFRVRDLLNNSIMHFDPDSELEWTAVAYAYFLPPQRSWVNRFGEKYTFDDLVTFLIQRPFDVASCGGSHSLYSLATILGVDSQVPILTSSTRQRLKRFFKVVAKVLVSSQHSDGSIDPVWYLQLSSASEYIEWQSIKSGDKEHISRLSRKNEWREMLSKMSPFSSQMLITGHVCEAAFLIPVELRPDDAFFLQTARYLEVGLFERPDSTLGNCPYTHALVVLDSLVRTNDGEK